MNKSALSSASRRDALRLYRTARVGPVTFRHLMKMFAGDARAAIDALPELASRGGGRKPLVPPPMSVIDDELAAMEACGVNLIAWCDPEYPAALSVIDDAPPFILARGQVQLLRRQAISIVGARNASLSGRQMAAKLSREIGQEGFLIVSGLARGVDAAAHEAALATGTAAVIAGSVEKVYPEENNELYQKMIQMGVVLSDQPMGTQPQARLFPRRNRLIAGLSLGTIVVEAAKGSGSLITAQYAADQGREVFAVPGSPLDPRARGGNDLLRQGAILTESVADVLNHLASRPSGLAERKEEENFSVSVAHDPAQLARARELVLEAIGPVPVSIDDLVRAVGMPAPLVLSVLLELDLAGRLDRQTGQKVALIDEEE